MRVKARVPTSGAHSPTLFRKKDKAGILSPTSATSGSLQRPSSEQGQSGDRTWLIHENTGRLCEAGLPHSHPLQAIWKPFSQAQRSNEKWQQWKPSTDQAMGNGIRRQGWVLTTGKQGGHQALPGGCPLWPQTTFPDTW